LLPVAAWRGRIGRCSWRRWRCYRRASSGSASTIGPNSTFIEALACLDRMLVLQPDSGYALRRRAWICTQFEQHDQAEADYREAVDIDSEDTVTRLGLAQILLDIRKNDLEAAEHFQRLWEGRKDATTTLGLAQSRRLAGRSEEARRLLDDWLASDPEMPWRSRNETALRWTSRRQTRP
jgi:Flp pilus assembly protein TadD